MKKSTLITTIAMIVVVVVALSTATYAWFTSSTATVADASISVTGEAGWVIAGISDKSLNGTYLETATFDSSVEISSLEMPDGLYSPICASDSANLSANLIAGSNSTTFTLQQVQWFTTEQDGTNVLSAINVADTIPSYEPYLIDNTPTYGTMTNYMRVSNATGDTAGLRLTLTVLIDASSTEANKLAAQNFCSFITWREIATNGTVGDTAYYTNTAYDYAYQGAAVANSNPAAHTYNKVHVNAPATSAGSAVAWTSAPSFSASGTYGYTDASTSGKGLTTSFVKTATNEGYYYQYVLDFGELGKGESVALGVYSWFNGWAITSSTPECDAQVSLAFTTTPTQQP